MFPLPHGCWLHGRSCFSGGQCATEPALWLRLRNCQPPLHAREHGVPVTRSTDTSGCDVHSPHVVTRQPRVGDGVGGGWQFRNRSYSGGSVAHCPPLKQLRPCNPQLCGKENITTKTEDCLVRGRYHYSRVLR